MHTKHHNYTNFIRHAGLNKEFGKAVNFAAFCRDTCSTNAGKRESIPVAEGTVGHFQDKVERKSNISDQELRELIYKNIDLGSMAGKDPRVAQERLEKFFRRLRTIVEAKPIVLTEGQLKTSSSNDYRGTSIDGNPETYWHVKYPREEVVAFVEIDLERERQVRVVRILPRAKAITQFWGGIGAFWLGSEDGHKWYCIAGLDVDMERLKRDESKWDEWLNFILPEDRAFRYYQLKIIDPHFLSFAEIELFE